MSSIAIHPIVRQCVDRCHVGTSLMGVVRYVISRLAKGRATFASMPRDQRRLLIRQCAAAHAENGNLYNFVTLGR